MKNTMTYAVALSNAINLTEGETRETLTRLLESINKRNARKSTTNKPTKKQVENEGVKENIRNAMRGEEPQACKAIADKLGLTPQKVNALLKQMIVAGEVVRSEGKKKVALFALADAGADEDAE
jgi:predicted Rossmann fold nucleotide-binding protein DprA/Smf involved in DNA uptake